MKQVSVIKTLSGWEPTGEDSILYHRKGKLGNFYHIDISQFKDQRNAKLNAKYWVMLAETVNNQEQFINTEQLHIRIKKVLGIVEKVYNPLTMAMEEEVGSTAFEKMDNEIFSRYFQDALTFICRYVITGTDEDQMMNRVHQILGFS